MIVNYDSIKAAFEGFRALYTEAYTSTEVQYPKIAMTPTSTGPQETYDWLGDFPKMREWLGDRQLKQLRGYKYTIVNKDWESTIEIDRNHFEDDTLGLVTPRVQALAMEAKRHLDELVFGLLSGGFLTTCYDGQYFFDIDHSEGNSGIQSNKGTSALSKTALESAIATMMNFKSDEGKPIGIIPDTLVVPPALLFTALELIKATQIVVAGSTDVTKPNFNALSTLGLQVISSPYLTDVNDWFLLATKYPVKPLIAQTRREPEFNALMDPQNESVFKSKKFLFGVDGRYNAGYGLWQLAYGSQVA